MFAKIIFVCIYVVVKIQKKLQNEILLTQMELKTQLAIAQAKNIKL